MNIKLTNSNLIASIDNKDFHKIKNYKWYLVQDGNNYYAYAHITVCYKKYTTIKMHRIIINARRGEIVDHIDGNGLNNKKKNLIICSHQTNMRNRKESKFRDLPKGVSFVKNSEKFRARIMIDKKEIHLGVFNTVREARISYKNDVDKYFKGINNV